MSALARPVNVHETAPASAGQIMAMAAAVAQELSERWPFAVVRLRVALSGPLCRNGAWEPVVQAVTLGLSGIVDFEERARIDAVLGLQHRMMAIRLSGRKLVAFHPARDLQFRLDAFGAWVDGLRVDAVGADGRLLGSVERVL